MKNRTEGEKRIRRKVGKGKFFDSLFVCVFLTFSPLLAQQGNRFVFTQLQYNGPWDPYAEVTTDILTFLERTTSIEVEPQKRVLGLKGQELFTSPFLVMAGKDVAPNFSNEEMRILRDYLEGGGFLWVEDVSAQREGSFSREVKKRLEQLLRPAKFKVLPKDHAVYRSFYLLKTVSGRRIANPILEGLEVEGRSVVIVSQNDILGAWAKDRLGNYLYPCSPGGEKQRMEAMKLTMNIILYALTGTYKQDAIHQPFIEQKLR